MADSRISELAAIADGAIVDADEFEMVDKSETSMAATGTNLKATFAKLYTYMASKFGSMATQASSAVSITGGSVTGITDLAVADGGTGSSTAANARTALGVAIGSDVQAYDTDLAAIAALVSAADKLAYATGAGTWSLTDLTSFARTLLDDANQAAARTTLGLTPGTDVQAYDAELAAIAGLTSAADRLPYFTGSGSAALATFTAAGRALVDDADAAAQRATLGVGTTLSFVLSDETTAITTGTKLTYRIPFAMTLTTIPTASLTTASSSGVPQIDIKESGTTIFSTKLTIDANETTSTTAATAAVLSDTSLAADAELTFIVDVAGTGAAGLKVSLTGYRT